MYFSASKRTFLPTSLRATYEAAGTWPEDAVKVTKAAFTTYRQSPPQGMTLGADADGYPVWVEVPATPLADLAARKRDALESGRKAAEQAGITYSGIRYAGDPSNRQALMEALDLADTTGQTVFASWKDSDGLFHADHPVSDVRQALLDIATRRGQLIAREGELNAQIDTALAAEDREALESIEW